MRQRIELAEKSDFQAGEKILPFAAMRRLRFLLFLLLALIGISILVHFVPLASRLGANEPDGVATVLAQAGQVLRPE